MNWLSNIKIHILKRCRLPTATGPQYFNYCRYGHNIAHWSWL